MKIAFVIPKDDDQHNPQNQYAQGRIFPPVGLARMAGIVGRQASVAVVDERIEPTNHSQKAQIAIIFIKLYEFWGANCAGVLVLGDWSISLT